MPVPLAAVLRGVNPIRQGETCVMWLRKVDLPGYENARPGSNLLCCGKALFETLRGRNSAATG